MLLFEIEGFYNGNNPQPYLEILYKTIFCLGYYGMLRVGEMTWSPHTVKACDVHVGDNKEKILIVLYTSKTHGEESRPQKIKIAASDKCMKTTRFFCPFQTVIEYMDMRGPYGDKLEPFFVFADKSPVKSFQLRNFLRQLLENLNLDSSLYDVHSFRSGRTSDLAEFGYSIDQIKAMGRWKSNAVYRYLKD